ncbi:hypothetical protein GALL_420590 [mine drainage metagenome]|uniref:Uncharacterized protein n=1 Tax=mine drainage metagenome TaxID=410659 RepID=A0A1J5PZ81_9ZZZZ
MTSDTGTVNTAGTTLTLPAGNTLATVTVTTPNVGTITANVYQETAAGSGIFSSTAAETVTITVNAAMSSNTYSQAKSTVYGFSGDTTTAGAATATTDAAFSVSALSTASTTPVATFEVTQNDTNGVALTSGFKYVSVTASIGAVQSTHTVNAGSYVSVAAAAVQRFWIAPDGRTGAATITVAINGVTVKTYSITFYSNTVASLTATVIKSNVNAAAVTGFTAPTHVLSVVAKDSSGNAIPSLSNLTATSSDTAIANVAAPVWSSADSVYYVTVTGVASGTATVTIKDSSATVSTTAVLKVSKAVASTVTLSLDKAAYAPGDKGTVTLTAKDSNGSPVADGTYTAFLTGALTASASVTSTLLAADVTFTNGVATATFYAPLIGGPFSINGTTGTAATLATAVQSAALSAAATVTTTPDAAVAAAKAAADAATAAVATLSTTVATLIAAISYQLRVLNVLIKRIMTKLRIR